MILGCNAGGRLIAASHAIGYHTVDPPSASVAASVRVTQSVRNGRVVARLATSGTALGFSPVVQVSAVCAGEAR
jgi:hypothetical protein